MKQAHLLSAAVFRAGQPSRRGLYGSFAKLLLPGALLITVNLNEDNSNPRDLENPIPGVPGALPSLRIEREGTTCWNSHGEAQLLVEKGANTESCRYVAVVAMVRSNGPSRIFINGDWAPAVPGTGTTTACAIAIHRAGANGEYT